MAAFTRIWISRLGRRDAAARGMLRKFGRYVNVANEDVF
jgi:hypothetical protein